MIDSSRVKIKQGSVPIKNLKISPYQINWNPATKQVVSKPSVRASSGNQVAPQSSRQLPQMLNYGGVAPEDECNYDMQSNSPG